MRNIRTKLSPTPAFGDAPPVQRSNGQERMSKLGAASVRDAQAPTREMGNQKRARRSPHATGACVLLPAERRAPALPPGLCRGVQLAFRRRDTSPPPPMSGRASACTHASVAPASVRGRTTSASACVPRLSRLSAFHTEALLPSNISDRLGPAAPSSLGPPRPSSSFRHPEVRISPPKPPRCVPRPRVKWTPSLRFRALNHEAT